MFYDSRHLKDNHEYYPIESSDVHEQESSCTKPDFKFNYHQNKLVFGLLLFDFNDAVREGDGERLFDIYKLGWTVMPWAVISSKPLKNTVNRELEFYY